MVKPNFFLVGAPKCGTTAMFEYLSTHPDIYLPKKELHYFGSDIVRNIDDLDTYLAVFADWQGEMCVGDVSVWYLHSMTAAQEIKDFNPDAKIIIMLRDPVEMMYAAFYQLRYTLDEDLPTFAEALAAEQDRKSGRRIPATAHRIDGLFYRDVASYAEQVRRQLDTFGCDAVHVIIFDDFKADTAAVYRETLRFLEVDADWQQDFRPVNVNKVLHRPGYRQMMRYLKHESSWYPRVIEIGRRMLPQHMRESVNYRIRQSFTSEEMRPPLDAALEAQLRDAFKPEVEALSALLGRDLTHWCRMTGD